jgi:hypothetical protein
MKLKAICFDVDFRKSEATNYQTYMKNPKFPGEPENGETILFVSKSGNQLVWLLNLGFELVGKVGQECQVTDSRKWRLHGGTWNPHMLSEYARMVNIELMGIKTFAQQYEEERQAKKNK